MKEYLKNELKHLPLILIMLVLFYGMTVFAASIFQAQDADYDNSDSGIVADRAQGAIDELHSCAVNYQSFNQRLTTAKNIIGVSPLTTTSQNLIGAINEINNRFDSNGVLKIANGGTGATTAAGARTNLDMPSTADIPTVIPLQNITGSGITAPITKYGHVVTIKFESGTFTAALAAGATIMTVPEGYRPVINTYFLLFTDQNATSATNVVRLHISTEGAITTPIAFSKGKLIRGTMSYVSA